MLAILVACCQFSIGHRSTDVDDLRDGADAATLPVSIVPFLFLMNDYSYVRVYRNGWFSNAVVLVIIGLAFVLAMVAIPLQIFGGS